MSTNFWYNYGWLICIGVIFIIYIIRLWKRQGKEVALNKAREIAFELFLAAQKKYGSDCGEKKMNWVIDKFYPLLPETAKMIFSEEDINKYLQNLYNEFKDFLDDGKVNESFHIK